jgi:hypothetical protein
MIYLDRLLNNRLGTQMVPWDVRFGEYHGGGRQTDIALRLS